VRFQDVFARFGERMPPRQCAESLLDYHVRIQRGKPPNGKAPWFERFDDGSYMIRPMYRRDEPSAQDGEYVYPYRTRSLWSFAMDLGVVR